MSSKIPEATLTQPHTFRDWEEDGVYHCLLSVAMPGGNVTSFAGKGSSARKARTLATFNASYAVKMQALDGDDTTSSDDTDQDEGPRQAEDTRPTRDNTFTSGQRAVQSDPTPMQSAESTPEDEDGHPADSRRHSPRQSELMHDQDSDIDFDEEAPLLVSHSALRATPGTANEGDAAKSSRALCADMAIVNSVVDPDDSSDHVAMFVQDVESPRTAERRPGDEHLTNQQNGGVAGRESNPNARSKAAQLMTKARIVDFDSDASESSSDDDVEFVQTVPQSQVKKRISPVRGNERLAHDTEKNVGEKQVKLSSGQLSPSAQQARTKSLRTAHFQQSQTSKLFIYRGEESEDSSPEPARCGHKTVFQSNSAHPSSATQSSSSSAGEMENLDSGNIPAWPRQHSGNQASASRNASSQQAFLKSSLKRRKKPRTLLHSSRDRVPGVVPFSQPSHTNQQRESYIIEPSIPNSNVRNASATRTSHPLGVRSSHTVDQPRWNTMLRTQDQSAVHSHFHVGGNVQMQSAPKHRADPSHHHNRGGASMWEQQNSMATSGASDAFPHQYTPAQVIHGTSMRPISQEMNGIPPYPIRNGPSIPVGMSNAMPVNSPPSVMFSDPRYVSSAPSVQNPFPTPSQNLVPHSTYGPSIQHHQFPRHSASHSIHGSYPFALGMGGLLNPFGQTPKSDMHTDLESIRRAAIANAQAAVERDLPDTKKNSQGRHDVGLSGKPSRSSVENQHGQDRANAVNKFSQFQIQIEGTKMGDRTGKHEKMLMSDNGGSLKRRRISHKEKVDIAPQNEERPISPSREEKICAKATTVTDKNAQGSADEPDEDYVSALHLFVRRTKCFTDPLFDYSQENTESERWECIVRVRRRSMDKIGELIEKSWTARTRKKAKQGVSKNMLTFLSEMLLQDRTTVRTKAEGAKSSLTCAEKGRGTSTAIGALIQLWHWKILQSQPDARLEEIDGGKWKCTFVLMLADKGLVTVSEVGPQKKISKRYAAHKALDHLRELKVDGAERFTNVMSLSELYHKEKISSGEIQEGEGVTEDIVKLSDDEDGEVREQEEIDGFAGRFVLPKSYKLTVATTPLDCDDWIRENAKGQSDMGFYIGSYYSVVCRADTERDRVGGSSRERETPKGPLLCFSSQTAGLVLRADKCLDSESKKLDVVNGIWLPIPVRLLLKSNRIRKHGHGFDDVMMRLLKEHGVRTRAMNDIAITSFAVTGFCCNSGIKILWTIQELAKHWLQKEIDVSSGKGIWEDGTDMPRDLGEVDGIELSTAALHACVCIHVREQVSHGGMRKRTRLYGPAAEFQELSKRLMYSPFVAT